MKGHHPRPRRRPVAGFTLIELMLVCAVVSIIMSFAIPLLFQSRLAANEAGAIQTLRMISKGMEAYRIQNRGGAYQYPADFRILTSLNPPDVDPLLSDGEKSGYRFTGGADGVGWNIVAVPVRSGISGEKTYFVDESCVIRSRDGDGVVASASDSPIQ